MSCSATSGWAKGHTFTSFVTYLTRNLRHVTNFGIEEDHMYIITIVMVFFSSLAGPSKVWAFIYTYMRLSSDLQSGVPYIHCTCKPAMITSHSLIAGAATDHGVCSIIMSGLPRRFRGHPGCADLLNIGLADLSLLRCDALSARRNSPALSQS